MLLYVFSCPKVTNIWAGIGARKWAVSKASPSVQQARHTKAGRIKVGQFGVIYRSDIKAFTTPFIIMSSPDLNTDVSDIWPETWTMPFDITPLGSPVRNWSAYEALDLPFNRRSDKRNLTSVFNVAGTQVFVPINIGEED